MADYIGGEFNLIKLHGSVNWAHEVRNFPLTDGRPDSLVQQIINKAPDLDVNEESFEIVYWDPFNRPYGRPLYPALAIPVVNKPGYECPKEHQKVLNESFPQVTKVLIVGWSAGENKFLKSVTEGISRRASIMVVSRNESSSSKIVESIFPLLREAKFTGDIFAAKSSFSDFLFSPEISQFLD